MSILVISNNWQTIERYVTNIVDLLKPKPTISAHLITTGSASSCHEIAVNLLSNLTALYGDSRLVSKSSKAFGQKEHQVDRLRSVLSRVTDQILSLSRQYSENEDSKTHISESRSFTNENK